MLLKAKPVVEAIEKENSLILTPANKKYLNLAIVEVGSSDGSEGYISNIIKQCHKYNIGYQIHSFPEDVTEETVAKAVANISNNLSVSGCILMQPFPKGLNMESIKQFFSTSIDIDGTVKESIFSLLYPSMDCGYAPATAEACIRILKHYNIPLDGAHVVVIGRSMVVGKPVAMLLDKENATVTLCNSHTKNLQEITKSADIVIAALGKKNFLTKDYFSPNQTVIDVGFHCDEDGISGDVDKEVVDYVKNITPVPGGVGSVTTAVLINHLYKSANKTCILKGEA